VIRDDLDIPRGKAVNLITPIAKCDVYLIGDDVGVRSVQQPAPRFIRPSEKGERHGHPTRKQTISAILAYQRCWRRSTSSYHMPWPGLSSPPRDVDKCPDTIGSGNEVLSVVTGRDVSVPHKHVEGSADASPRRLNSGAEDVIVPFDAATSAWSMWRGMFVVAQQAPMVWSPEHRDAHGGRCSSLKASATLLLSNSPAGRRQTHCASGRPHVEKDLQTSAGFGSIKNRMKKQPDRLFG